jgi:hypothetical protein
LEQTLLEQLYLRYLFPSQPLRQQIGYAFNKSIHLPVSCHRHHQTRGLRLRSHEVVLQNKKRHHQRNQSLNLFLNHHLKTVLVLYLKLLAKLKLTPNLKATPNLRSQPIQMSHQAAGLLLTMMANPTWTLLLNGVLYLIILNFGAQNKRGMWGKWFQSIF